MADEMKNSAAEDDEKWARDSSLDHRGRPPLRSSTGSWKAALFIVAIEFGERMSYYGLSTSLILYLTKVMHQEPKTAAKNVNYWGGVTTMMPLVGGFVADAYLGRFSTVFAASLIYIMGLALLTMSQVVPRLKPCAGNSDGDCEQPQRLHVVVFFLAIYLISVATGGHKPALESFGADQFDDNHAGERRQKTSYFNWWNMSLCSGLLIGVTAITYLHEAVGWWLSDIVLTAVLCLTLLVFVAGRPFYRYRAPEGCPFTPMVQVVAAAITKRKLPLPSDAEDLHELPKTKQGDKRLLCHTNKLRFLDKAAIKDGEEAFTMEKQNPWRLATVTQVEELKLMLGMAPIWLTVLPFGISMVQESTFFIKQASIMNRKIGGGGFEIPAASVFSLSALGMVATVVLYDKLLEPFLRRATGRERGISILQRIGVGLALSVGGMAAAALVERKRLEAGAEAAGSMSVFWLVPQYLVLGISDGFALVGLQEYFYEQVPDGMRSLGMGFYLSTFGMASFLTSFFITVVDRATARMAGGSWFGKDLNKSRLDRFYWLVAALGAINLSVYVYLASRYSYKRVQRKVGVAVADAPEAEV